MAFQQLRVCTGDNKCSLGGNVSSGRTLYSFDAFITGSRPMSAEQRKADYLAKAKEAEEMAEKTADETAKAEWLRIAAGYHALAGRQEPKKS